MLRRSVLAEAGRRPDWPLGRLAAAGRLGRLAALLKGQRRQQRALAGALAALRRLRPLDARAPGARPTP